jgi:hypothetical protein
MRVGRTVVQEHCRGGEEHEKEQASRSLAGKEKRTEKGAGQEPRWRGEAHGEG